MISLLFDSGFWYDLIFIAVATIIIFLCFKYPNSRVYVFSFLGIIFVGITAYCGIQLNYYYTAEGGVWGYITGLINDNQVTTTVESDTASFSLENIVLTQNSDGSYSAVIYNNDKIKLKTDKTYGVYVNNEPCTQVDFSSNFVRAEYHYAFLDNDLETLCDDTLQFNFAFYANGSTFTLTTYGGQEAVNYWNTYFARNNLIVEVKPIGYVKDDELSINGQIDDYSTLSCCVDDNVTYSYIYTIGSKVTEFPSVEKEGYIFAYWQDINGNKVESLEMVADTNLYAHFYETVEEILNDHTTILEMTEKLTSYDTITNDIETLRNNENSMKVLVNYTDGSFQLYDNSSITYDYIGEQEVTGWYYTTNHKELSDLITTTLSTYTISFKNANDDFKSIRAINLTAVVDLSQVKFIVKHSDNQIIGPTSGNWVNCYDFQSGKSASSIYFIY